MMCTTFHILVDLGFEQIQLVIGPDTGIAVGWQRQGKKNAGSGELKVSSISLPPLFCPCFGRLYVYKAWVFWGTLQLCHRSVSNIWGNLLTEVNYFLRGLAGLMVGASICCRWGLLPLEHLPSIFAIFHPSHKVESLARLAGIFSCLISVIY